MREEYKPGDLSVRIGFGRIYSNGPDSGRIKPTISITDQTSGSTLELEITPDDLAGMLSGSEARVSADKVKGFRGISRWGKYLKVKHKAVTSKSDDYTKSDDPLALPHVAAAVQEIEADGYRCAKPSLSHGTWRITGRRYDEKP